MIKFLYTFLVCIFSITPCWANSASVENCKRMHNWHDFTWLKVTLYNPDTTSPSTYEFIKEQNEKIIYHYLNQNEDVYKVLIIPNVGVAFKDEKESGIKPASECQLIVGDTVSILYSQALRILYFLGRIDIAGPQSISVKKQINIKEDGHPTRIQINPGDHFTMGTPWELSGTVNKNGDSDIVFDFKYEFYKEGKQIIVPIKGVWSNRRIANPIKNQDNLSDWLVCIDGTYKENREKQVFVPVISNISKLKTIGDLRNSHSKDVSQKKATTCSQDIFKK